MNTRVWNTVKLGTGLRTTADFRTALVGAGCKIITTTHQPFVGEVSGIAENPVEINLVSASVKELGFEDGVIGYQPIFDRARQFGLVLCSIEVGPQICLQGILKDNEAYRIAMEPFLDSVNRPQVHDVCRFRGETALSTSPATPWPNGYYDEDTQWLFMKPRR